MSRDNLKEQAAQKEKEWRELQQLQYETLEASLKECQKELKQEHAKLQELTEHFKYNLKLIKDRDAELERYDALFLEVKSVMQQKEQEISDLKIKIDELNISLGKEAKAREEMQLHYQQRLREKQVEMEEYRSAKDAEVNKEREGLESIKHSLDRQVIELQQDLDTQRHELTAEFEEASRRKDHEYRVACDNMNATILSHELKVKLLTKELELVKAAQESRGQEFEQVENTQRELENQLRQKEWEIEDTKTTSNARIAELEGKLLQAEQSAKRHLDDFQRKLADADRSLKEKDCVIAKLRDSMQDRDRQQNIELQNLTTKLEESAVKMRQLEWNVQDAEKEKSNIVEKLESEVAEVRLRWETDVAKLSRENVARDVQLNALRDSDAKLRSELQQRKHDIERYKRDLALSVQREAALEQSKAQLEFDWQRRCEDIERLQYASSEDLVRSITKARDEALAEIRLRDSSLVEKDDLIKLLTKERDQALATLNRHGLMADRNIEPAGGDHRPSTVDAAQLQRQNEELKQVIRQMRKDMEALVEQMNASKQTSSEHEQTAGGVIARNIEAELVETKSRCQQLEQILTDYERGLIAVPTKSKMSDLPQRDKSGTASPGRNLERDSTLIASHMQQLNNVIGSLRSEKVELTAQLRKSQLRVVHLENMVDQLSKQPREKQVELDQLQYELGATKRRTETEVASLRQRISDLELQVTEARKEADEYYRASVERNTETTALANQLSQLKLEMAKSNPTINFGAQELLIQQFQDEILRLRQQLQDLHASAAQGGTTGGVGNEQLRNAARQIAQLVKEKEILMELGNRLRAELLKNGIRPPSPTHRQLPRLAPPVRPVPDAESATTKRSLLQENVQNKLKELEKLQYELTKQQMAQKHKAHRSPSPGRAPAAADESSESEADRPRSILKQRTPSKSPRSDRQNAATTEPAAPLRASTSSYSGGESLQEVWRMMDADGLSSRGITPRLAGNDSSKDAATNGHRYLQSERDIDIQNDRPESGDSWTVKGSKTFIQSKSGMRKNPSSLQGTSRGGGTSAASRRTKIRNYNIRDDSQVTQR